MLFSPDFYAGYLGGAAGILIGNPLDIVKVQLQAGGRPSLALEAPGLTTPRQIYKTFGSWIRGSTAPILTCGALSALLFVTYNKTLRLVDRSITDPANLYSTSLWNIWMAGAVGGIASWVLSAPSELIKCRTQLQVGSGSSWGVARDVFRREGIRGLYLGGTVTSVRDSVGFGFYFWSYELSKRIVGMENESERHQAALKILLCGGIAGVISWASIYPLDMIKTRIQAAQGVDLETNKIIRRSAWTIARDAYRQEGAGIFFRGLGVCSIRAFIVNSVQWAVYEWTIDALTTPRISRRETLQL